MTNAPVPKSALALFGGTRSVTAPAPESFLHGPQEIGDEEIEAVTQVLRSRWLFRFGKDREESSVAKFEALFSRVTGASHVLAVNSGTSALIAGLVGLGVSQGDEVLIPAYTYVATAAAVVALGAFPVIVEVDGSLTMDPLDLERKISPRTTAVIPVHMRGTPCNMEAICRIAQRRKLAVLEDCAQANGGEYKGKALGTWGDVGIFSLQHYKVITAGEGGVVVTNRREVFDRVAIYHDSAYAFWMEHEKDENGQVRDWRNVCFLGENFRQSEVHGAIALEQLKKRARILERTRAIKRTLWKACETIPGICMEAVNDREGDCGISLAFFARCAESARNLAEALGAEGVRCGTMFSKQIPDRHIFYHWDYIMEKRTPHLNGFPWNSMERPCAVEYTREMCPRTQGWLERAIVLPITQAMSDDHVAEVGNALRKVGRVKW
ncbi:MAG TPA: aminotransferase class I/II-fold pyridoxal phosphate-dependent enzyme [Chthoniobacteraceae bacterium]|nr:aminotransferase class I/II-fold pyridoxal phosphate-dependent enzyme [Chthoniobacteraceae bacterium]